MTIPDISFLHLAVLSFLRPPITERSSTSLRGELDAIGLHQSNAAFYELMLRLERKGFVTYRPSTMPVRGRAPRFYAITLKGRKAIADVKKFVESLSNQGVTS